MVGRGGEALPRSGKMIVIVGCNNGHKDRRQDDDGIVMKFTRIEDQTGLISCTQYVLNLGPFDSVSS